MYIMCLIIFEKKVEIQDQHHLSLNRDRDRLQKYWAIKKTRAKFETRLIAKFKTRTVLDLHGPSWTILDHLTLSWTV